MHNTLSDLSISYFLLRHRKFSKVNFLQPFNVKPNCFWSGPRKQSMTHVRNLLSEITKSQKMKRDGGFWSCQWEGPHCPAQPLDPHLVLVCFHPSLPRLIFQLTVVSTLALCPLPHPNRGSSITVTHYFCLILLKLIR